MFKTVDYNIPMVIGTPLVAWKCEREEDMDWLKRRHAIKEKFPNADFFAALEVDARGIEPFERVISALNEVGGTYWTYMINDNEEEVTSKNRWIRIETGRNLIREFAQRLRKMSNNHWGEETPQEGYINYEAVLYVDSDISLGELHIEKMLEVDHPLVGIDVPQYQLQGEMINDNPRIEQHWNTAGMLLVNAPAYYDLVWHHNSFLNLSDDPSFQSVAERLHRINPDGTFGEPWGQTWVRKDFPAYTKPLVPVETRNISSRVYNES